MLTITGSISLANIRVVRILLIFTNIVTCSANAEHFAFRARENYEVLGFNDGQGSYQGLTSSINFFFEKPYDISYGLILNPGLGTLKSDNSDKNVLGNQLRYFELGGDLKYFPLKNHKFFMRKVLAYQHIETQVSLKRINAIAILFGLGWEFWLFDLFSLAPEVSYKYSNLANGQTSTAVVFSVGLHFYQ
jgi:hypothetical protein